jgi:glutathione S-transferase
MTLQLYYTRVACSMVPYINLTEAQADFEVMPLNFSKGEHMSPEYLRLNPKHRVPVLMIDGEPLTESVAINPWIARTFPDAPDSEESVKQCAQKLLAEHFGIADALLAGREWVFDHYTAPDAYFFWTFLRALRFDGISTFQNSNIATRILIA